MSKTQENKIWLVTFLDLLMIMTCFFVLIYSINLKSNKKGEDKSNKQEVTFVTDRSTSSGPLEIIYNSLINYYQDDIKKVHILKSKEKIRLFHSIQLDNKEDLVLQGREIGASIFNFSKNLIKTRLIVDFDKLLAESALKSETLPDIMENLTMLLSFFRSEVAKYSSNDNIIAVIEGNFDLDISFDKSWYIVTDIYPEPKYTENEIY